MAKTIQLNFPPKTIGEYVKKWQQAQEKNEHLGDAEKAMATDIRTLVEIAISTLKPAEGVKDE